MDNLLLWIPLLPAIAAFLCGVVGPRVLKQHSHWPALAAMGGSLVLSLILWSQVRHGLEFDKDFWTWFAAGKLDISFGLRMDALSATMCLVVGFVGLLIFIYSVGYMKGDPGYARYFAFVSLFAAMMFTLVLGNNLVVLFLGWEGVGLCSYLLIGFWYQDYEKASAAKKAFIVNRIGDAAFLIGMFLLFQHTTGTLKFSEMQGEMARAMAGGLPVVLVALCLFIGATGKSAQIPLYTWLPDAMAGPTPVSALIHAATMVTAGIYMITRCHFIYDAAPAIQTVVAVIGALTALVAALIALTQNDIKKVLAYSTVSQLGYMFLALGTGAYVAAIFHLVTHAFFKACLFMVSGSVIHAMHEEQDMRKMGGLKKHMPWSFWSCVLSGAALAALPPFAGFWSKDEVLVGAFGSGMGILGVIGLAVGGLTAFYITRLIGLTFLGEPRSDHHAHEAPWVMTIPVAILAVFSVIGGVFNLAPWTGKALSGKLHRFLGTVDAHGHAHGPLYEMPHLGGLGLAVLGLVATAVALGGIWLAWTMIVKKPALARRAAEKAGPLYRWSLNKFYVDEAYDKTVVFGTGFTAWNAVRFDRIVIDGALHLLRDIALLLGFVFRIFQNGQLQRYGLFMVFGVVLVALAGLYFHLVGGF